MTEVTELEVNFRNDALTEEERCLQDIVVREWQQFGRSVEENGVASKDGLRKIHAANRLELLRRDRKWISTKSSRMIGHFANGADILPDKIKPRLVEVNSSQQSDLFRFARYTWSLPYSKGFGRRLRFLIFDDYNGKIMGLLGLQSPPLDLGPRDRLFSYPENRKVELVNQTMDIFVQGAIPPYNILLGGKLIVLASASKEIRQAYRRRYINRLTEIDGRKLSPHLVALTTTSAFGKSSLYNRAFFEKDDQRYKVAESLGFMQGYGSFQFSEKTYELLKHYVTTAIPGRKVTGFGSGPRVKWQVITLALQNLGIKAPMLRHSMPREAYLVRLVDNLEAYLGGQERSPSFRQWSFKELSHFWKEYYLLGPRRQRPQNWREWDREQILNLVSLQP